jgi:hypothetical protein
VTRLMKDCDKFLIQHKLLPKGSKTIFNPKVDQNAPYMIAAWIMNSCVNFNYPSMIHLISAYLDAIMST